MRAVDDDTEPPPEELRMAWMCKQWEALPDTGGVLDQDYVLLTRMSTLHAVYAAVSEYRNAKGDAIHRLSPSTGRTIKRLTEGGIQVGGLRRG